jgi:hypothetical protein
LINNRQQNGRRRGRGGQQPRNGQSNPHSSNRIDNRQRGNAAQLLEKYKTLARDAQMAGDRVNTEYYLQFADHYFRVLSENRARFEEQQGQGQAPGQPRRGRDDFSQDDEGEEDPNPFTRPYTPRDMAADDGWEEEDGDQPQQAAQPTRERRDHQPRERRPAPNGGGERADGNGERSGYRDGGNRSAPREAAREGNDRGYRENNDHGAPREGERSYRDGGDRNRRGGQAATNGARPPAEPGEAAAEPARNEAEAPARIEIALPPALTTAAAPATDTAAPELPMDVPAGEEAAPPKRRRTRKPKADAAPAEA